MPVDNNCKTKIIVDYILSQIENDNRPYLQVEILGTEMLGLLDSGSCNSILGNKGWQIFNTLGLPLEAKNMKCTVANGQTCSILGSLSLPVKVLNKIRVVEFLVIPELPHYLILGLDFWKTMGVVPDVRKGNWVFSKDTINSTDAIYIQSGNILTPDQKSLLENTIEEIFKNTDEESLGKTNLVSHKIIVNNSSPIKSRYYPVNPIIQSYLDKEIESMLRKGIIEKSNSPWSSPVILVKKKDNTYRFCVDYRKLNAVTEKDAYAIPYVSHTLDKLRNARFLSSLDIKTAYWQVPMDEESKKVYSIHSSK